MRTSAQAVTETPEYQAGTALFDGARSRMNQMSGTVEMIGGAIITLAIIAIVLQELFTLSIVNSSAESGPFSGLLNSIETTGSAALTLVVVGLIAAAASVVLGMFRGRF